MITGALTLNHIAKYSENPLEKFVIMNLLRDSNVFGDLPFVDVDNLENVAVRWTSLPTPAFRKINSGYTPSVGDTEQVWETVYPVGGEFKIDRILKKVKNLIKDPVRDQIEMHIKATALLLNDKFINGDHTSDPDTFEGIKKRVASMPSRQTVGFAGASAAALDPTSSTANARAFLDTLDKLWKRCNGGKVDAIYCNEGIQLGLARVLRYAQISGGNFLDTTKDVLGRDILTFKGVPLVDVGIKKDQVTDIILETETAGDAGSDATSMYFASFDDRDGMFGIQLGGPLELYDPLTDGELEGTPTGMIRYEWVPGISSMGSRAITRGYNIEGAANWT